MTDLTPAVTAEALCDLIPHAGEMCLLDEVIAYDDDTISCTTKSHQLVGNPLRNHGKLDAVNLIEYGAQAMAVHGGLLAKKNNQKISQGYLASVRNVKLNVQTIDDIQDVLTITANQLMSANGSMMYAFEVKVGSSVSANVIASGRLMIVSIKEDT